MSHKFELVSALTENGSNYTPPLPSRATANSAGYDFVVSETTLLKSYRKEMQKLEMSEDIFKKEFFEPINLKEAEAIFKENNFRPTLVPTGIKCRLDPGYYLELSVRSSFPLKSWIILANGVGIVDADYYNNKANEGQIYFQLINLGPYDIVLNPGDRIGQGIIKPYALTEDDHATGVRAGGFGSTS